MKAQLQAALEEKIQEWLDENADSIGSVYGILQDDSSAEETAKVIADGAATVVLGMVHQASLYDRFIWK